MADRVTVHVYRNNLDDKRGPDELHFCHQCEGWYGVPHEGSHCQRRLSAWWPKGTCACRFCRIRDELPIAGDYGFFTEAAKWQPPKESGG